VSFTKLIKLSLLPAVLSTIHISAAAAMTVSAAPETTVTVGQEFRFVPTVQDGITANLQFAYINKPNWSKGYRGSGLIEGKPTQPGVYANIQIVASDGLHYAWSKPFTITVVAAAGTPSAPVSKASITGAPTTSAEVGKMYSFTPTLIATGDSKWTYSVSNKPAWATFNASTGTLSGTPTSATPATYEGIVIGVSNGTVSATLPAFGIDVEQPVLGTASLAWTKPVENASQPSLGQLKGYTIVYGKNPNAMNKQLTIGSGATSAEIENLTAGTWYFKVAAISSSNVVGAFSATVGNTIL